MATTKSSEAQKIMNRQNNLQGGWSVVMEIFIKHFSLIYLTAYSITNRRTSRKKRVGVHWSEESFSENFVVYLKWKPRKKCIYLQVEEALDKVKISIRNLKEFRTTFQVNLYK